VTPAADVKPPGPAAPRGPNSAPEHFKVKLATTKGDVLVDVHRHMAPLAADQFYKLVKEGFYDGCKFFRVATNPAIVQFGMNGDPAMNQKYQATGIPDEPRSASNVRGTLVFAKSSQPNSRTTQLFINRGDNSTGLDSQGFAPFGRVVEGLEEVVDAITDEYAEQPDQQAIGQVGNTYLDERFPNLDYIVTATIVGDDAKPVAEPAEKEPAEKKPEAPAEQTKDEAPPEKAAEEKQPDAPAEPSTKPVEGKKADSEQ